MLNKKVYKANNKRVGIVQPGTFILAIALALPLLAILLISPNTAHAWPTELDWIPLVNSTGANLDDVTGDAATSRDIVGDSTYPAASLFNDGTYIYYRVRVDQDPYHSATKHLRPFGWGFLIDTDGDFLDYEWMVMADGITDGIYIAENTTKTGISDPSDKAELVVEYEDMDSTPGSENYKTFVATSNFAGDPDYFIEFRFLYTTWLYKMGLDDTSVINYFVGSSNQAQTLTADLVQGSTLSEGMSIEVTPDGTQPTTGSVAFRNSIDTADLAPIYPGATIYIKVTDIDQNSIATEIETITVVVNTPSGDSETVTLFELGINNGTFWGSITTTEGTISTEDGTLQLFPVETITVDYFDTVAAGPDFYTNQHHFDYVQVNQSTDLEVTKTVNISTPNVGDTITYTLSVYNYGPSDASGVLIEDQLPSGVTNKTESGDGTYNHASDIWTVGVVNAGDTKTINIDVTVNTGTEYQSFNNIALLNSIAQYDPNSSNDSDNVFITIQGSDIQVTKVVDDPYPAENDYVTFTVTAKNLGSNDATNILLEDIYDADLLFNTSSGDGIYNSITKQWGSGYNASGMVGFDLTVGSSVTLTISSQINTGSGGGTLYNFANIISADQADPSLINNSATASVAVGGTDLEIQKSVSNSTPNAGETVTYTITVTNIGPNNATFVTAQDWLPSDVTYVSDDSGGPYNSASGIWTIGSLPMGGNVVTLNIDASVDAGTGGQTLTNIANITGIAETDLDSSNDSASVDITVQSVDIEIAKVINTTSPAPNGSIQYTITTTNNGPDTATNIVVTDVLPANISGITSYPDSGTTYASDLWTIPSLGAGLTNTLIINATAPGTTGEIATNTATLTSVDQEDSNSDNDSDIAAFTVGGTDFEITKIASTTSPNENDFVDFTITVTNNGPFDATNVIVMDTIPSRLTYDSHVADPGTSYSTGGGKAYQWDVGDLAVGITNTLVITVQVTPALTGETVRNTARFLSADQADIYSPNNIASVDLKIGSTDLSISKIVNNTTPNVGDIVQYTITVTNNGLINGTYVDVQDLLPSGVTFNSAGPAGVLYNSANGLWNVTAGASDYIGPGLTNSLIINATVDTGTEGDTINNQAQIINAIQPDPDSSNNLADVSITVQSADLSVQKTVDDATPIEGNNVEFTITVSNNGPHDATGVLVTDNFPSGLTYISDDSGGLYNSINGDWSIGNIAKATSSVLKIIANAPIGTGGNNYMNTAFINTSDVSDTLPGNNSDSIVVSPETTPKPLFIATKTVVTSSDPINASTNPIAIPGALILYTFNVMNMGDGYAEEFIITDSLSNKLALKVDDVGGPFTFTNNAYLSSLIYNYVSLGDVTDDVEFDDGNNLYDYTPIADANGVDSSVRAFRINFGGIFNEMMGANTPTMDLKFKVRLQ